MNVIQEVHDRVLARDKELSEASMPLTVDDVFEILQQLGEEQAGEIAANEPEVEDNRAVIAEHMLDNYHLLKTNLKTREAIYHTLCAQGASQLRRGAAMQLVEQAKAELNQQKWEILELMGVDS